MRVRQDVHDHDDRNDNGHVEDIGRCAGFQQHDHGDPGHVDKPEDSRPAGQSLAELLLRVNPVLAAHVRDSPVQSSVH